MKILNVIKGQVPYMIWIQVPLTCSKRRVYLLSIYYENTSIAPNSLPEIYLPYPYSSSEISEKKWIDLRKKKMFGKKY